MELLCFRGNFRGFQEFPEALQEVSWEFLWISEVLRCVTVGARRLQRDFWSFQRIFRRFRRYRFVFWGLERAQVRYRDPMGFKNFGGVSERFEGFSVDF